MQTGLEEQSYSNPRVWPSLAAEPLWIIALRVVMILFGRRHDDEVGDSHR